MSFSTDAKNELINVYDKARHCRIAELSAICMCLFESEISGDSKKILKIYTENLTVMEKYSILFNRVFDKNIKFQNEKRHILLMHSGKEAEEILETLKLDDKTFIPKPVVCQQDCCKRAFVRGVFLACGNVVNPEREYHLEMVFDTVEKAEYVVNVLKTFDVSGKVFERKKNYVLYIKDGSCIADILNLIGAHLSLMNFENVRILKDVRNDVNRHVNCDSGNIKKMVKAATKQVDDIIYLRDHGGFEHISDSLKEIALLRISNPDISLKELGEMMNPPLGKSGVNHRMRKLCDMANNMRNNEE